ncbi:hypothetical protein LHYA1_G007465, partial [Lachnellula hyalina]
PQGYYAPGPQMGYAQQGPYAHAQQGGYYNGPQQGYGPQPGYGPPQGAGYYYGQPQGQYVDQRRNGGASDGFMGALLGSLACCCCLDACLLF